MLYLYYNLEENIKKGVISVELRVPVKRLVTLKTPSCTTAWQYFLFGKKHRVKFLIDYMGVFL